MINSCPCDTEVARPSNRSGFQERLTFTPWIRRVPPGPSSRVLNMDLLCQTLLWASLPRSHRLTTILDPHRLTVPSTGPKPPLHILLAGEALLNGGRST